MRWPIHRQILLSFGLLLLLSVGAIAVTSAVLAARRSTDQHVSHLRNVVETLGDANFPYTRSVLIRMRGLSGAHFVTAASDGAIIAHTLSGEGQLAHLGAETSTLERLAEYPAIEVAGHLYFVAGVPVRRSSGTATLFVLYPVSDWYGAQWDAAWPPLAIGAATFALMAAIAAWLAQRISGRIETVRGLFAQLADGQFAQVTARPPQDEVHALVLSANQLSARLAAMQEEIRRTERLRLLAQLAGGLAHQLRNAVTGARMAVQLHLRRCDVRAGDESLDVALRQLALTEQQIKGILSLGRQPHEPPPARALRAILDDVGALLGPVCRHARVGLRPSLRFDGETVFVRNGDALQAALLNLALNAVEAAGEGGSVEIDAVIRQDAVCIEITDSGSGPPDELGDSLLEPFVTTKPEGVGLGLTLAQQAAQEHEGTLEWCRRGSRTVFTLRLPLAGAGVWLEPSGRFAGHEEAPAIREIHSTSVAAES